MPRSRRSRKLATWTSIALGFVAGIFINLLTSWLQKDILSNILLLIGVGIALVAIGYLVIKTRAPLLISAFVVLVVSVFFNLFSSWVQEKVLHDTFTTLNVTLIFFITIIVLGLSAFIGSHPISKLENRLMRRNRRNARIRLAQEGIVTTRRKRQTRRKKK